jgi:hypothetical protein
MQKSSIGNKLITQRSFSKPRDTTQETLLVLISRVKASTASLRTSCRLSISTARGSTPLNLTRPILRSSAKETSPFLVQENSIPPLPRKFQFKIQPEAIPIPILSTPSPPTSPTTAMVSQFLFSPAVFERRHQEAEPESRKPLRTLRLLLNEIKRQGGTSQSRNRIKEKRRRRGR